MECRKKLEQEAKKECEEYKQENDARSEALCTSSMEPCQNLFFELCEGITLPMDPKELDQIMQEARTEVLTEFRSLTTDCSDHIRKSFEGQLNLLVQSKLSEIIRENDDMCREVLQQALPEALRAYEQAMSGELQQAVPKKAVEEAHKRANDATMDEWNSNLVGSEQLQQKFTTQLQEQIAKSFDSFVKGNESKSEEYCTRLVDEAYKVYDANMKIIKFPALTSVFEAEHAENEGLALSHYKDRCVGTQETIANSLQALRELIQLSHKHYATENEPVDKDGQALQRTSMLHRWKMRKIFLSPGDKVLRLFGSSGKVKFEVRLDGTVEITKGCGADVKLPSSPSRVNPSTPDRCLSVRDEKHHHLLYFATVEECEVWFVCISNVVFEKNSAQAFFQD